MKEISKSRIEYDLHCLINEYGKKCCDYSDMEKTKKIENLAAEIEKLINELPSL